MTTQLSDIMRPQNLDELIGNEGIKKVLRGQFESGNIAHTFLLTGGFGLGKTTISRIIANAVGDAEIIEHDAGAKSDIDTIRNLVESSNNTSLFGEKKVYIFDEVHKLSKDAQTVLLKVTEEPPKDVYFILSSSEEDKIIPALVSRCIKLTVEPATLPSIREAVDKVVEKYGISVENRQDWKKVVERSNGSLRTAYNLIDALIAASENNYISTETFDTVLYTPEELDEETPLVKSVISKDLSSSLRAISLLSQKGEKAYPTTLSLYRYLKKSSLKTHRPLLTELAYILYDKDRANSWEGIEYALLKAL